MNVVRKCCKRKGDEGICFFLEGFWLRVSLPKLPRCRCKHVSQYKALLKKKKKKKGHVGGGSGNISDDRTDDDDDHDEDHDDLRTRTKN